MFEIWECADCSLRFTQNVPDETSIAPYYQSANYVSHSNTKKGIINRLYHVVRNYTLGRKRALVKNTTHVKEGRLLDVGAGVGAFAYTMQKAGWQVTGLEPDETARANALKNFRLHLDTLDALHQLPDNSYNAITMWHVMEHVHDVHGYFKTFHRILKPGGRLIIAVPNYTSKDADIYGKHWAAYDVPRHLYHFSPTSMEMLAHKSGFIVDVIKPMWFDSFYICMLSEQYQHGMGNILLAFRNGFLSNLAALRNRKKCSSVIYVLVPVS